MRWVLVVVAALLMMAGVVVIMGARLPEAHVAAVEARYSADPAKVYALIINVADGPRWRTGLQKVEVLSGPDEPLRWRETADWGTLTFLQEAAEPEKRVVARIADTSEGFGGTWTYELTQTGGGTRLLVTEHGEVHNPVFRFLSKYVFGHYRSLETYVTDLGRSLGEDVTPVRVNEE